jgi:signal transduction histidine kinase
LDKKQQTESFTILSSNANNLLGIVNQILDFSKAEAGKLVLEQLPFELGKVFEEMVQV